MHLKPDELTAFLDGQLPAGRRAHLDACGECRARAGALAGTLQRASEDDVPEPSPLFWEHFPSRVAAAIRAESPRRPWVSELVRRPEAAAWAASALIATLVLALAFGRALLPGAPVDERDTRAPEQAAARATDPSPVTIMNSALEGNVEEDDAWALVRVVADAVPWEQAEAAGFDAGPDAAEALVVELTDSERAELARLLASALKESGA